MFGSTFSDAHTHMQNRHRQEKKETQRQQETEELKELFSALNKASEVHSITVLGLGSPYGNSRDYHFREQLYSFPLPGSTRNSSHPKGLLAYLHQSSGFSLPSPTSQRNGPFQNSCGHFSRTWGIPTYPSAVLQRLYFSYSGSILSLFQAPVGSKSLYGKL